MAGSIDIDVEILLSIDENANRGIVILKAESLAKALKSLIVSGSNTNKITIANLHVIGSGEGSKVPPATMEEALKNGTKFFDAVVYFSLLRNSRPQTFAADMRVSAPKTLFDAGVVNWGELGRIIAIIYLYIAVRANYPSGNTKTLGKDIPAFAKILGIADRTGDDISQSVATFPLEDLGFDWVRYINIKDLGVKLQNRLGLGVAGRRWFKFFELTAPTKVLSVAELKAYQIAVKLSKLPASWDWHPATRDPKIIAKWGSINKALQDLAAFIYTPEEIVIARNAKLIPIDPVKTPQNRSWVNWTDEMVSLPVNQIFI